MVYYIAPHLVMNEQDKMNPHPQGQLDRWLELFMAKNMSV